MNASSADGMGTLNNFSLVSVVGDGVGKETMVLTTLLKENELCLSMCLFAAMKVCDHWTCVYLHVHCNEWRTPLCRCSANQL